MALARADIDCQRKHRYWPTLHRATVEAQRDLVRRHQTRLARPGATVEAVLRTARRVLADQGG